MNNYDKYYKELIYQGGDIWEVPCEDYNIHCDNCILCSANRKDNHHCGDGKNFNIKILKEHFNERGEIMQRK